ncbi:hypothetical protein [Qipengyuania sp. MTN3-11]|uniref:hypothetical protein n=1 Tax=Qipengyuania sp. MTN3-11 TaxID=3056557 RepID=UPI0036F3161D
MSSLLKSTGTALMLAAVQTVVIVPIVSWLFGNGFRLGFEDAKFFFAFLAVILFNRWLSGRDAKRQFEPSP